MNLTKEYDFNWLYGLLDYLPQFSPTQFKSYNRNKTQLTKWIKPQIINP